MGVKISIVTVSALEGIADGPQSAAVDPSLLLVPVHTSLAAWSDAQASKAPLSTIKYFIVFFILIVSQNLTVNPLRVSRGRLQNG